MKTIITSFIIIILSQPSFCQWGTAIFKLNIESFLIIKGSSNINKFECKIDGSKIHKQITIDYQNNGNELDFQKFKIELGVDHFDCKNPMITSDFKKSLRADEYPLLTIDFLKIIFPEHLEPFERLFPKGVMALVSLTNKNKEYYIELEKDSLEDQEVRLRGIIAVNMRDFDLEPPEKMFTLIKVNPLLDIQFSLSMTRIKNDRW